MTLLTKSEDALAKVAGELAGTQRMVQHAARSEHAMRQELMKAREEEPGGEDVLELMELWRAELRGGSQRVSLKMGGPRANRVRWALKRFPKAELVEAILGCAKLCERDERQREYSDLADHIFKSERSIESNARLYRNATREMPPREPAGGLGTLPTEEALAGFQAALAAHPVLLARLKAAKGWDAETLARLGVGWNGQRLLIPIRDEAGVLVNVMQYAATKRPKMLAVGGRPRGLFPAPESVPGDLVWLLEGEGDAITAHTIGLPGVGVPGTQGWRDEWAARLKGRMVVVCFDADKVGRAGAQGVARSLVGHATSVRLLDLFDDADDGSDLTDAVMAGATLSVLRAMADAAPAVHSMREAA